MAIRIKRSSGDSAPGSLASGQLAYVEGSTNGGTLYIGEIGGTVRAIGGKKYIDKLNGIEAGAQVNDVTSVAGRTGDVVITASDLADFNSTVDGRITSSAITTALGFTPEDASKKGAANGYAPLGSDSKISATYLPSYVDDVLEYADLASFPGTGATGIIYVAKDTNKTYRWSGSAYVEISASPGSTDSVTEGSTNLYFTNSRARSAISVTDSGGDGSLSYDSGTGVITYTGPSASEVRAHLSAGTGISYSSSTGVIASTITQYTNSDARGAISVTQNLSYDSGTGVITGPDLSGYLTSSTAASTYQPLDADLTAIAGLTGTGILKRTGSNTWSLDTSTYLTTVALDDVSDVYAPSPSNGQTLQFNTSNSRWEAATPATGVTAFTGLSDVPNSYSGKGSYWVRVNSGASALEFSQDVDDGTF